MMKVFRNSLFAAAWTALPRPALASLGSPTQVEEVLAAAPRHAHRILNEAVYTDEQAVYTSSNGELNVTLTLGEALYESEITGLVQKVVGYNGFVGGPTLRVKPGDVIRITLRNELPEEACDTSVPEMWNQYHGVSETNLHVHGLFVPSEENPILVKILPGEEYAYTINIPEGHQGGTHWYHPHVAGSTTLQAGGGGMGFLIVEDVEGDLPSEVASLPEVTMRIQFFNFTYLRYDYATGTPGSYVEMCRQFCLPEANRPNCSEYFFENGPEAGEYNTTFAPDGLEYETLLVNGIERPTFELTANQWYRFRTLYVPTRYRTIEPTVMDDACDFMLLAKDGKYMPITPRDIHSGYMVSGSRADFLVRCKNPGVYEFQSLSETPDSSNWIASQHRPSLERTMAYLDVKAAATPVEDVEVTPFQVKRPCYLPDMMDMTPDEEFYIIQSGLTPPLGVGEVLPESRPEWSSRNISYYAINNEGPHHAPTFEYVDGGSVVNSSFSFPVGSIFEIDYFVPQIHPLHMHIFGYQVVEFPTFDSHNDYFVPGDYHDVMLVPVSDAYEKAVLRTHVSYYATEIFLHCHFYRHSDRGMAMLGESVATDRLLSPKVSTDLCYSGLDDRGYELVPESTTEAPTGSPDTNTQTFTPTGAPATSFAPCSGAVSLFAAMLTAAFAVAAFTL